MFIHRRYWAFFGPIATVYKRGPNISIYVYKIYNHRFSLCEIMLAQQVAATVTVLYTYR